MSVGRADLKIRTSHGTIGIRRVAGGPSEEAFLYLLFASNRAPEMALMPLSAGQKGISAAGPVPFDERELSTAISRRAIRDYRA